MIYIVKEENFYPKIVNALVQLKLEYVVVERFDILNVIDCSDITVFIWNFTHNHSSDIFMGKSLVKILEDRGVKCFPSYNDCWTYNDKVTQYLLFKERAFNIPVTELYFSDLVTITPKIKLPVVMKLRGGAGSSSVRLIKTVRQLKRYFRVSFQTGVGTYNYWGFVVDSIKHFQRNQNVISILKFFKRLVEAVFKPNRLNSLDFFEPGYVLAQEFIANCNCDYRIIVSMRQKAWGIVRGVRKDDFRASGSGIVEYNKDLFPPELIQLAFDHAESLKSDFVAFDYLWVNNNEFKLVEYSYGLSAKVYDRCEGYWSKDLSFTKTEEHLLMTHIKDWLSK